MQCKDQSSWLTKTAMVSLEQKKNIQIFSYVNVHKFIVPTLLRVVEKCQQNTSVAICTAGKMDDITNET